MKLWQTKRETEASIRLLVAQQVLPDATVCTTAATSDSVHAVLQGALMKQQQQMRDLMADLEFSSPSVQALQVRLTVGPHD
jgi:hypothetical protein